TEIAEIEGSLNARVRCQSLRFGFGIRIRVVYEELCDLFRSFTQILHRTREPAIDRPIGQQICEQEHEERWRERHQESAEDHLGTELRTQNTYASLRQQLEQIAQQDEGQCNKEQEHQR